ncbi:hypothetical protein KC342_g83 [Hortaea werneckii]|nr:hypothetical protein KC342_g83 [Hortaea werneckii]
MGLATYLPSSLLQVPSTALESPVLATLRTDLLGRGHDLRALDIARLNQFPRTIDHLVVEGCESSLDSRKNIPVVRRVGSVETPRLPKRFPDCNGQKLLKQVGGISCARTRSIGGTFTAAAAWIAVDMASSRVSSSAGRPPSPTSRISMPGPSIDNPEIHECAYMPKPMHVEPKNSFLSILRGGLGGCGGVRRSVKKRARRPQASCR